MNWIAFPAGDCRIKSLPFFGVVSYPALDVPATATLSRSMRSDALKNRERLLVAAGQVFEEKGLEASVADVARVAGVGMGTLYRRFASKEALIEALVSEVLEATIAMAQDAAPAAPAASGNAGALAAEGADGGAAVTLWLPLYDPIAETVPADRAGRVNAVPRPA